MRRILSIAVACLVLGVFASVALAGGGTCRNRHRGDKGKGNVHQHQVRNQ